MIPSAIKSVTIERLSIPLRRQVSHAAASRHASAPVIVIIELQSGTVGCGEALPRDYVTGESESSVVNAVRTMAVNSLLNIHPPSFAHAIEAIDALPSRDGERRPAPAARAAVELALLDAYSKHFARPISDAAGWMGLHEFGPPGSLPVIRHSGVLATNGPAKLRRLLRLQWWYGLRHFKLKVGGDDDEPRVQAVCSYLHAPMHAARCSVRVDANGAWTLNQAIAQLGRWTDRGFCMVEQPLAKGDERDLPTLKAAVHQPLMHDESLLTMDDAQRLVEMQVADGFNIRISKCGGLMPAMRLAAFARKHGVSVQLGCMVGETSILSAAGRKFLELVPNVRFAEGSFGRFLLSADIVPRPLRFTYAGRVRPLPHFGLGINVDPAAIQQLRTHDPVHLEL